MSRRGPGQDMGVDAPVVAPDTSVDAVSQDVRAETSSDVALDSLSPQDTSIDARTDTSVDSSIADSSISDTLASDGAANEATVDTGTEASIDAPAGQ